MMIDLCRKSVQWSLVLASETIVQNTVVGVRVVSYA